MLDAILTKMTKNLNRKADLIRIVLVFISVFVYIILFFYVKWIFSVIFIKNKK